MISWYNDAENIIMYKEIKNFLGHEEPKAKPSFNETRRVRIGYSVLKGTLGPLIRGIWIDKVEFLSLD